MIKRLLGIAALLGCAVLLLYYADHKALPKMPDVNFHKLKKELERLPTERLKKMLSAGKEVENWQHILAKTDETFLTEFMKSQRGLRRMTHLPIGDVVDKDSRSHYYYHVNRGEEFGHFHLYYDVPAKTSGSVHLVAVSTDHRGTPIRLFLPGKKNSGDRLCSYQELSKYLDKFHVNHAYPSWICNQYLGAVVQLFYPQILMMVEERDRLFKDALDTKILSEVPVSIPTQIKAIEAILQERA
ncbi:MAG: hypothetical protein SP1CHLAM54_12960 [Chlamydiia bacterium]|nr:hypothetical protein [Chlamydiia bacterium]MCH9616192.1 hypothetical protein [Chlamydiia bacterium]MCH9629822.1 hypothetical protein [Chlamydiia bacterium]